MDIDPIDETVDLSTITKTHHTFMKDVHTFAVQRLKTLTEAISESNDFNPT